MPVDQVIISYLRHRDWINVLLFRSSDMCQPGSLDKNQYEMIEVAANGISFSEQHREYRILLDEFFELTIQSENGVPLYGVGDMRGNSVSFGLLIQSSNIRLMDQYTVEVPLGELPLRITSTEPCSLHCSNCANEVIGRRQYLRILPVPVVTMRPYNVFSGRGNVPVCPREEQLFYGLNYVVICLLLLGTGVIRQPGRRQLQCSRCRQLVGMVLGDDIAVQLFADTLRVVTGGVGDDSPVKFREIFGHVTATQLMMRLLHDAEPINSDKARLLLKTVRPDGQLHFLLMLVDTQQLHILRSEPPAPRNLESTEDEQKSPRESDTSSESDVEMKTSDTSSSSISSGDREGDAIIERPSTSSDAAAARSKELQPEPKTTISYVELRGFRGCRIKYIFSGTDEELNENQENLDQWRQEGTCELRISFPMMMELVGELNANENMAAALEKLRSLKKGNQPRISYIIYESDEDFYARQLQPLEELDV